MMFALSLTNVRSTGDPKGAVLKLFETYAYGSLVIANLLESTLPE